MNREEKLALLSGLSEKDLTKKFLIPLFEAMGYTFVDYSHGRLEKGKGDPVKRIIRIASQI